MTAVARLNRQQTTSNLLKGRRPAVLLVEDSKMFSAALSWRISSEVGADVHDCSTASEMQAILESDESRYALAVVDLNLSDSPHQEVLEIVKRSKLPIVIFTGNFEFDRRVSGGGANIVDYVPKNGPDAIDDLIMVVQRFLSNRNTRVLVVGTSEEMRKTTSQLLKSWQFLVSQTDNGRDASMLLDELPDIDLVFVDQELADMPGDRLIKNIRVNFSADRLRIIGTSDSEGDYSPAVLMRSGADDYIRRPYGTHEFHCRVAATMDTLMQFRRLQAIANRDFLTDMYNRRHFFERGPALVRHSLELAESMCAAVLDIDHFKKFNDTYGHEVGDAVLKVVARKIREIVGDDFHLAARLGGEEFAVIFRNMNVEDATVFCDQLREEVAKTKIVADDEELSVTVSIGLAEIADVETFDNYLHAADQYLYMAKNSGRNCVFSDYSIANMFSARRESQAQAQSA